VDRDYACPACGGSLFARRYLDMTVLNRSNDLVWGLLGANTVHFSFLQEYLAGLLRLEVGTYHQVTNNLHVYTEKHWKPDLWLRWGDPVVYSDKSYPDTVMAEDTPLLVDPSLTDETFEKEVQAYVEGGYDDRPLKPWWRGSFFQDVAYPMRMAFFYHKSRNYSQAADWCNRIKAPDWGRAATEWIGRREHGYRERETSGRKTLQEDGN
jgi:hypothetical protein